MAASCGPGTRRGSMEAVREEGVAMKIADCPYCQNVTRVDDADWGLMVRCEGPGCELFFPTGQLAAEPAQVTVVAAVLPPGPAGRPAPRAPVPRLTGVHRCQVCHDDIRNDEGPVAFGRRR